MVCATHRSGSSYLCELLTATDRAGKPDEYFQSTIQERWMQQLDTRDFPVYLNRIMAERSSSNGVFGCKFMFYGLVNVFIPRLAQWPDCAPQNLPPPELLQRVFPGLQYIFMTRSNKARQAWSWCKARQTGQWHSTAPANTPPPEPVFDPQAVRLLEQQLEQEEQLWQRFFGLCGISPLKVVYEELTANPLQHTNRVIEFLGLPPVERLDLSRIRLHRQSNARDAELLAAYEHSKRVTEKITASENAPMQGMP